MIWQLRCTPPDSDTPWILYDLTRLIGARSRAAGSGVDRIDLALVEAFVERHGPRCLFIAQLAPGTTLLPPSAALRFVAALRDRWTHGTEASATPGRVWLARAAAAGRAHLALGALRRPMAEGMTYVNGGHSGLLTRPGMLQRLDSEDRMQRTIYLHDFIPIDYPEYQTPASVNRFQRFIDEAFARPVRVLVNSDDTAAQVMRRADARNWALTGIHTVMPYLVATGTPDSARARPAVRALLEGGRPWFIVVGTIEPRKNHLLLLHLWRSMATSPTPPPLLVIVGRRGWENEMVLDMLDRCTATAPHLREFGDLNDNEVAALLAGARALLMPSFAEGLGVPLLEAGHLGVPIIAADLPALREVAARHEGVDAVFLDPLDGPAWRAAIQARA